MASRICINDFLYTGAVPKVPKDRLFRAKKELKQIKVQKNACMHVQVASQKPAYQRKYKGTSAQK